MSAKSIQAVPATKPGQQDGRLHPKAPVSHWKRRSSIILMFLAAIAVIFYLVSVGLAKQYAGLGAALLVIACFGFLVWHTVHLFAEQDAFDEQQLNQADKEANSTTPPPESGQI